MESHIPSNGGRYAYDQISGTMSDTAIYYSLRNEERDFLLSMPGILVKRAQVLRKRKINARNFRATFTPLLRWDMLSGKLSKFLHD